ncbi:MAG: AAA family ATPase [Pseudomonadales bacterium]|nr:AAA family ATPase [Pseudomonadales bacterium]
MAEREFDAPYAPPLTDSLVEHLPFNQIAENSLLVALFESENAWDEYGILIKPDWFMDRNHRVVFEEMQKAANRGEQLSPLTVASRISARFSDVNHPAVEVVIGMHDAVRVGDTRVFMKRVLNDYVRRNLIGVLKTATSEAYEATSDDVDDLIEGIHGRIDQTSDERLTDDDIVKSSAPALMAPVQQELDYIRDHGQPRKYLNTGYGRLNELSWGGFRPGHLMVLAGRPGMGKTSFALNLCENVFRQNTGDVTVLFFTLEQRTEEIMLKMLSAISEVPFGKLKTTRLNNKEQKAVEEATESIKEYLSHFIVVNPDGLTINRMIHAVKQVKRARGRLDLVCVDYIGLMQPNEDRQLSSRTLEIAEITRGLKNLANQEEVPILALAQLNRNADSRADQRPRLSDLRDSGSIEQDADMVLMLHHDESEAKELGFKQVKLMVTKNRHGPLGTIDLRFEDQITVFEEIQPDDGPESPSDL